MGSVKMSATFMRRALAALTAIAVLGAAFELFAERHWRSPQQLVPWAALALLAVAAVLLLLKESRGLTRTIRVIAGAVLLASAIGVYAHVSANFTMGSFDQSLDGTWAGMSVVSQYWYALTKAVGNAPPLAPGMLAQAALLVLLATFAGSGTAATESRHRRAMADAD
ncbi:hypothetical protein GCM10012278_39380 [Nonomuraea glycinis]|uniref:Uncharacterized protein n=2 Tax=Nonomuraea glycinis TaxID=2047744 RepID=A0A918A5E0_9ACTN|nr:hypothetical protein GCM10012278_39380 [Nonomuraea glycinis]